MKIEKMKYLSDEISDINLLKKLIETLCDKSPEEVTKIVNELKKCDYDEDACEIATNPDVLDKRTIEEQIQLMKALKECDYAEDAYSIAIKPDVLDKRTIEEQIQLMKKGSLSKKVCHFENIENILTISEIKEYIEKLEEELGKDEDIKLYTKVSKYNKKKRKKLIFLKSKI